MTTPVTFLNSSGVATDLHGGPGSGVSGQAGDFAFNNTDSTGMGTAGIGGRASAGDIDQVDGLSSFTLQGWIRTSVAGTVSGARLIEKNQNTTAQISLQYNRSGTTGSLALTVGTPASSASTAFSTGSASLGLLDSWIFFAVTYDGTLATNNVNFYIGTTSAAVMQLGTSLTLDKGSLGANTAPFVIGNLGGNARPWDGFMDDVRVYGATSGSGGVLNLSQLEQIRSLDAVPEPHAVALIALGFAFCLYKGRRVRIG